MEGGGTAHNCMAYIREPQRVCFFFLRRLGLKTGIDFSHFWSGIGYDFPGNYGSV